MKKLEIVTRPEKLEDLRKIINFKLKHITK